MVLLSIPLTIGLIVLFTLITLGVVISQLKLKRTLRSFMRGQDALSLEESLKGMIERNSVIEKTLGSHKEALEQINTRLSGSIRGVSLVRYNAFADMGGAQSFAAGFLDEHGNGFILSVVTNRNHVGVYTKPVAYYQATVELTPEEAEALAQAKTNQQLEKRV